MTNSIVNEFKIRTKKPGSVKEQMNFLVENVGNRRIRYQESRLGEAAPSTTSMIQGPARSPYEAFESIDPAMALSNNYNLQALQFSTREQNNLNNFIRLPQTATAGNNISPLDELSPSRPVLSKTSQKKLIKVEDIGDLEELKNLGPKRNLAEELYRRIGPFDFDKNQARID